MLVYIYAINTFCISESASLLTFSFYTGFGSIFLRGGLIWRLHNDRIRLFVLLHSLISESVLNGGVAKSSTGDEAF